jgi:flagellin
MANTVMSASIRANLLSLQNTTALMDKTQFQLSTGKRVNSPLDDGVAFFAAKGLSDRATDLGKLLDAMGQSISGLQQATTGVTGLTKLVDQANAIGNQARDALAKGTQEAKFAGTVNLKSVTDLTTLSGVVNDASTLKFTVVDSNGDAVDFDATIAGDTPAADIVIGSTPGNALSIDDLVNKINSLDDKATKKIVEAKLNDEGQLEIKALNGYSVSMKLIGDNTTPGTTDVVDSTNLAFAQALGFGEVAELVANGTDNAGAVTKEVVVTSRAEASLNSVALFTSTGDVAKASDTLTDLFTDSAATAGTELVEGVAATDTDALVISVNGGAQKSYAIDGLSVQGLIDGINSDFSGSLAASFDATTGKINIRATDASVSTVQFGVEDDATTATAVARFGFGVKTELEAALDNYQSVESIRLGAAAGDLATFEADYNRIRDQIDALVKDAGYRGTNLLNGDTLLTVFNEDRSTSISTKGAILTASGLGLEAANFGNAAAVEGALSQVREATGTLRTFQSSLSNDLNVIQTRQDFTKQTINTLQEGSDKLTIADPNEEGATLLALQTRQQLAVSALSLASQAQQSVLSLLR